MKKILLALTLIFFNINILFSGIKSVSVVNFDCYNNAADDQNLISVLPHYIIEILWNKFDVKITNRSVTKLHYLENELEKLNLLKEKSKKFDFIPFRLYFIRGI